MKFGLSLYYTNDRWGLSDLCIKHGERLREFNKNSWKALTTIKFIINEDLIERFNNINNPRTLWETTINKTFGKNSLNLINRYFTKLINSNYRDFNNVDEYINNIIFSSTYLTALSYKIQKSSIIKSLFNNLNNLFDFFESEKTKEISGSFQIIKISI